MKFAKTRSRFVRALVSSTLLAVPALAGAVEVQSTTSIYLSFRDCVAGESVCDHFQRPAHKVIDGLPGNARSQGEFSDPEFGSGNASAAQTEAPGGSVLHASVSSNKGKRSGASAFSYRKYVNQAAEAVHLEVLADVQWQQTVPEENANIPEESPGKSGAAAHLIVEQFNVESIEAGTSLDDNFHLLLNGVAEEFRTSIVGDLKAGGLSNVSEEKQQTLSARFTLAPGEQVWVWAVLQSLAANGAEVTSQMTTELKVLAAE